VSASSGAARQRAPGDVAAHLERVDPQWAAWRRWVFGGHTVFSLSLGEVSWRLTFAPDPPPYIPMFAWHIQLGIERGWFALESVDVLGDGFGDALHGLEPAFVRALLAEEGARLSAPDRRRHRCRPACRGYCHRALGA